MAKTFFNILLGATLCTSFSITALAHPEKTDDAAVKSEDTTNHKDLDNKDLDAYFEKHAKRLAEAFGAEGSNTENRITIIDDPEALRSAARDIQNMLADSGVLENLADTIIALADDIEIADTGDGMSFSFDGKKLGAVEKKGEDGVSIEAFGKNTTIEKDVTIENGKKRTRIIIETDADSDVDYEVVPKAKTPEKPPLKNGF